MRAVHPEGPSPDPAVYPLTLYFDGACPICHGEMHNLMLRNEAGLLRFVDISTPGFSEVPPGTDLRALMDLMHARRADGRLAIGAEAIRLAYRGARLDGLARVMDLPLLRTFCDRAYPVLARNRYRIPRPVVRLVFETALRRAAERRAGRSPCRDGACDLPSPRQE
ncbi:DUF393 domain-containing protein [Mitsuaria sp. GD03876]|uniref:thiol-disulfide oxidoreductase DCC family protein n=1 Tax=Mitsuaria sp. GD03876 TaxID=2975399 RepID=UPI00244D48BA|nr:DUF393 domain-containing protein [Mitsuaria sp. GD03876]MDH0867707.1 DUF393 domain-containing protein [Mitsuaria sp. GD03876]